MLRRYFDRHRVAPLSLRPANPLIPKLPVRGHLIDRRTGRATTTFVELDQALEKLHLNDMAKVPETCPL